MQPSDDNVLLRQYAESQSDEAFTELVARHINLVYSVALRQVGNPSQAEEIAQAVFIIFAKKAAALRHEKALTSWMFQTTRFTTNNFIRSELRRQRREQEAFMQSTQNEAADAVWQQIGPALDNAVAALGDKDRRAILLRYYEGRSLREVGAALGVSESASEKRVTRALEKLRKFFFKRGLSSATAAIADSISANSVQAAPASLAKTISAVALAKGVAASASTLTLVKGALKVMAWTQTKTAIIGVAIALLGIGTTTIVVHVAQAESLECHLPDGCLLVLDKVSYGDHHEFVHGDKTFKFDDGSSLVVEFGVRGKNAATNPLVKPAFYRQFRCVIHGEAGIEYVEEFYPRGFKKYSDGFYNYVDTSIFPRDSRWLWFRIESSPSNGPFGPWKTVAEFKVPNPAHSANYPWVASPVPVTNTVNAMNFVLGEVTVEIRPFTANDIWNHVVTIPTKVFSNGRLLTNWGVLLGSIEDASGNHGAIFQRHRSLDPRYVWKLEMNFQPTSDFPTDCLATVRLPGQLNTITTNIMNVPVSISWDGNMINASIPANHPDLALKFVSATDRQGDSMVLGGGSGGQFEFHEGGFMTEKNGTMRMDINPTRVTLAVVPNISTTFYVQPRLIEAGQ